ncbi:MAG: glycoside hydrolase family 127 protein [Candidatus Omnitrophica bacterium]|nr:glycoside hydrolase family 127 protein [Candidatus Omnitrophota bacterium]
MQEYYRTTGDPAALKALERAADAATADQVETQKLRPHWGDPNTPWSVSCGIESALGALVVLGQQLGKPEYIAYAENIATNIPQHISPPSETVLAGLAPMNYHEIPYGHHTHSYLSIAHGIVDLAMATGNPRFLLEAEKIFDDTLSTVWMNGNIPEGFGQLFEHRCEPCSMVDWVLLCLKLFDATGEPRYLDAAELSILNQLPFCQDFKGGFAGWRNLDRHHWMDRNNWGTVADWCCSMHGGLAFAYVATHIVTRNQNALSVNLPLDTQVDLEPDGRAVRLSQHTQWVHRQLRQTLSIANREDADLPIKIRIPYWGEDPQLNLDGQRQKLNARNGFAQVLIPARSEQTLELSMRLRLIVIPPRKSILTLNRPAAAGKVTTQALQYGPFALMFYREMYPQITARDLSLAVLTDHGQPIVSSELPDTWRASGAIPLLLKAQLNDTVHVWLTPCANTTLAPFNVIDPYVMRFDQVQIQP